MDPMIHAALCVRVFIDYFSPNFFRLLLGISLVGFIISEIIYISDFLALLMMIEPTHIHAAKDLHKRIS
jgi:hypothetical protein